MVCVFVCDRPYTTHQILSPSALTTLTKGFIKFLTRKEKLYSVGLGRAGGRFVCVCVCVCVCVGLEVKEKSNTENEKGMFTDRSYFSI